jgi:hypothetical protein
MIIAIYINGQHYKNQDLGPVDGYDLAKITDEIRVAYKAGFLGDLAPTPSYSLSIQVVAH